MSDRRRGRRLGGCASLALVAACALPACGGGSSSEALVVDDATGAAGDALVDARDAPSLLDTGADVAEGAERDAPADAWVPAVPPPYDVHAADRGKCAYGITDKTTTTIGPGVPHGDALPFQHVVVLMLENRSFDHYLSKLPDYGVAGVDVAPDDASNPKPGSKTPVLRFHETRYCVADLAHNWSAVHLQYDDGKMDGFVATSEPGGERAMGFYGPAELPFYYWLAKTYAISDRHFSGCLGPTWPNRFFMYGATAYGRTNTPDVPPLGKTQILSQLSDAGRSWKIYRQGLTSFADVFGPKYAGSSLSSFDDDVKNDALADVSMIDPAFSGADQDDEHPPSNVQKGQALAARVIATLGSNAAVWKKTVLFITYDEHGGFYDHVDPPKACVPDGDVPPDFPYDQDGFRVPLFVVSRFAKAHYVSHFVTDHASIARFIENRFDLGAMTARDANAWPMLDLFDFGAPAYDSPASPVPSADPDPAGIDWCTSHPPGTGRP